MDYLNGKHFYSPDEFRKILPCFRPVIYKALGQRKICSFKPGEKYFIPASEVDRLKQLTAADNNDQLVTDSYLW